MERKVKSNLQKNKFIKTRAILYRVKSMRVALLLCCNKINISGSKIDHHKQRKEILKNMSEICCRLVSFVVVYMCATKELLV